MPEAAYSDHAAAIDFLERALEPSKRKPANPEGIPALLEDRDFHDLEARLRAFNPFHAMGLDTREVPHSNFLAYLMTPGETHGLDKQVLRALFPIFGGSDPDHIVVLREHALETKRRLDVFAYDRHARRAAIIETKVSSKEHNLQRLAYRQWLVDTFAAADGTGGADWRFDLIYLTNDPAKGSREARLPRDGWTRADLTRLAEDGSDEDSVWCPLSYDQLATLLDPIASEARAGDAVRQYGDFLRLHICPRTRHYIEMDRAIAERHAGAIAALLKARLALRRGVLHDLSGELAAIGVAVTRNGGLRTEAAKGWVIAGRPDLALRMDINLWGPSPSFMLVLEPASPGIRDTLRERFDPDSRLPVRRDGHSRVISFPLALPSRIKPFPLTRHNRGVLSDHLALALAVFTRDHVVPGKASLIGYRPGN